jgi:GntR family transcriptional regulator
VAELFDIDEGGQVVRREWHTGKGQQRTGLHVTWYPAHFAASVPELLSTSNRSAPGLLAQIQQTLGRTIKAGRDDMHSRDADAREANYLGVRIGSPILAGAHRLWDDEGVIEYGEWCLPYRLTVGYEYTVEDAPPQ